MSKFKDALQVFIQESWLCQVTSIQFDDEDSHAEYFTVEILDREGASTIDSYKVTKDDGNMIEEGRVYSQSPKSEDWFFEGNLSGERTLEVPASTPYKVGENMALLVSKAKRITEEMSYLKRMARTR